MSANPDFNAESKYVFRQFVAQIFNLLYRRFAIGRDVETLAPSVCRKLRRVQLCDTAQRGQAAIKSMCARRFPKPQRGDLFIEERDRNRSFLFVSEEWRSAPLFRNKKEEWVGRCPLSINRPPRWGLRIVGNPSSKQTPFCGRTRNRREINGFPEILID